MTSKVENKHSSYFDMNYHFMNEIAIFFIIISVAMFLPTIIIIVSNIKNKDK